MARYLWSRFARKFNAASQKNKESARRTKKKLAPVLTRDGKKLVPIMIKSERK